MSAPEARAPAPLIEARRLTRLFAAGGLLRPRPPVQAVRDVDLVIRRGEAVGVVGESGSGKSTLGRLLLGLIAPSDGEVLIDGRPLPRLGTAPWRALRRRLQIVFQDPFGSLDPRRRVGAQIGDGPAIHALAGASGAGGSVAELLDRVGLAPEHAERFPHEFSGGQRQRIGIARALAVSPELLVADEPVSALDVSIQAQIIRLLADLRAELSLALMFISHDLLVVRHLADRVLVLYLGRVMEEGPVRDVFERPAHPYTRALISATPRLAPGRRVRRIILPGDPPSPTAPPSGCVFRTRCAHAVEACAAAAPALAPAEGNAAHRVACIRAGELGRLLSPVPA